MQVETDVLVIGSGAAGMYAAIEAARAGCQRAADRPEPDRPRRRHRDGADDGRGGARRGDAGPLEPPLPRHARPPAAGSATSRCRGCCARKGPDCIREMDDWGVGWARKDGHIAQAFAPGHDRPRCVYVDFLNTGPAVSKTLRTVAHKTAGIRRAGDLCVVDLVEGRRRGRRRGRAGIVGERRAGRHRRQGDDRRDRRADPALPPQQRLRQHGRRRLRAGLRAGAPLIDMEFVQFFPIGHLAPRLIGMDPIMWDPFRYKLGGRLLNGDGEEFTDRYGVPEDGTYVITRDLAHLRHPQGGRGRPRLAARRRLSELPACARRRRCARRSGR